VGLYEAFAVGSFEWLRRHLAIINELERFRVGHAAETLSVLDFGGADGSLARAVRMYGLQDRYRLTLADIDQELLAKTHLGSPIERVILLDPDGGIPERDAAYDVAVSSDVFEHIPAERRAAWATELRRVSRHGQVHSMPCDSADGKFQSTETDRRFNSWYEDRFGEPERWTSEHLVNGVPQLDEIARLFQPTRIQGLANVEVWLAAMERRFDPVTVLDRLAFAARYARQLRQLERRAPFKNCLVVVDPEAAPPNS
jgi:hypothetical protein